MNLSQIIGSLLAEGYSIEFDPIGKNTMVSVHFVKDDKSFCAAQAVGPTPTVAVMNLLDRIIATESLNPSLAKLVRGLK